MFDFQISILFSQIRKGCHIFWFLSIISTLQKNQLLNQGITKKSVKINLNNLNLNFEIENFDSKIVCSLYTNR